MLIVSITYVSLTLLVGFYGFFAIRTATAIEDKDATTEKNENAVLYRRLLFLLPGSIIVYGLILGFPWSSQLAFGGVALMLLGLLVWTARTLKKYSLEDGSGLKTIRKMGTLWFAALNVFGLSYLAFLLFISYLL